MLCTLAYLWVGLLLVPLALMVAAMFVALVGRR
jgi:hypothetical protein